jgi:hypothetical protein
LKRTAPNRAVNRTLRHKAAHRRLLLRDPNRTKELSPLYRDESNTESRVIDLKHTIDPGFVNRRLVQTIIGDAGMKLVDQLIGQIPPMPDRLYEVRINHAYSQVLLGFCEALKVKTLGELLASGNGHLFCSTEQFLPCPNVYDAVRVESVISSPGNAEYSVVLEYSTDNVRLTPLSRPQNWKNKVDAPALNMGSQ